MKHQQKLFENTRKWIQFKIYNHNLYWNDNYIYL